MKKLKLKRPKLYKQLIESAALDCTDVANGKTDATCNLAES